ncbi:hypothetical protein V5799_014680 [Amblyomma americanum]|uniref:Uncharacterized protein n=1 Tax=Amblyomma americanum TaxID=6943 RepID=A0AAQ4E2B5_AMBAM
MAFQTRRPFQLATLKGADKASRSGAAALAIAYRTGPTPNNLVGHIGTLHVKPQDDARTGRPGKLLRPHDLLLQTLSEGWGRLGVSSQPQLNTLIGSARAIAIDNLFIAPEALRALVSSCPETSR